MTYGMVTRLCLRRCHVAAGNSIFSLKTSDAYPGDSHFTAGVAGSARFLGLNQGWAQPPALSNSRNFRMASVLLFSDATSNRTRA